MRKKKMIYLDNAATSYPKPPMVVRAMAGTLSRLGGNPGRSGHKLSLCGGRVIEHCREILAEELEAPAAEQIVFTSGCTEALNLAIRGSLFRGDEVLCSHAEHNAVMRVLKGLEQQGEITVRVAEPDSRGTAFAGSSAAGDDPKNGAVRLEPRQQCDRRCPASAGTGGRASPHGYPRSSGRGSDGGDPAGYR